MFPPWCTTPSASRSRNPGFLGRWFPGATFSAMVDGSSAIHIRFARPVVCAALAMIASLSLVGCDMRDPKLSTAPRSAHDPTAEVGLIEEVEGFLREGLRESHIAMQAHGYKEVMGYLLGCYDRAEAIRLLKRNTRHYAKYQLGWMRQMPELHLVRADQPHAEVVASVLMLAKEG